MKHIFLIVALLLTAICQAQTTTSENVPDSLLQQTDTQTDDQEEAGGISAGDNAQTAKEPTTGSNWLWPLVGGIVLGSAVGIGIGKMGNKNKPTLPDTAIVEEPPEQKPSTQTKTKTTAADIKKMKDEIKTLKLSIVDLNAEIKHRDQSLIVLQDFDRLYYNEVFKKVITPLNDAMEKGIKAAVVENLMKAASHLGSVARHKIEKKQPYDEANINYMLNRKTAADGTFVEINAETPLDKTPKNIKIMADILKEAGSHGLDETIIAGHKLKNL